MKTILVPTDFSPCAANALKYAALLAQASGANLHLLHSIDMPANPNAGFLDGGDRLIELQTKEANDLMKEAIHSVADQVAVQPHVAVGDVMAILQQTAKKINADLIVMGTEGDSAAGRFLFSSLTSRTLSLVEEPVLVVPDEAVPALPRNATYATDFDQDDKKALIEAKALLQNLNLTFTALHIRGYNDKPNPKTEEFEAFFRQQNINLVYRTDSSVEDGILGYMADHKPDLMVLLRAKRGFFGELFSTSITKKLTYVSHTPLLILKEK